MSAETCWMIAAWLASVSCLLYFIVFIGDLIQLLKRNREKKREGSNEV